MEREGPLPHPVYIIMRTGEMIIWWHFVYMWVPITGLVYSALLSEGSLDARAGVNILSALCCCCCALMCQPELPPVKAVTTDVLGNINADSALDFRLAGLEWL